jgi:hypothetical protein
MNHEHHQGGSARVPGGIHPDSFAARFAARFALFLSAALASSGRIAAPARRLLTDADKRLGPHS